MLYLCLIMWALCAIVAILKGDMDLFFRFAVLTGIYLIPVSIDATFKHFFSVCNDILQKGKAYFETMDDKYKEYMTKKGSTTDPKN